MITVGVRELKQQTSQLIRRVREDGEEIQVTYRGDVVALVIPVQKKGNKDPAQTWVELDLLAAEINSQWPEGISAIEAVSEGRR